MQLRSFVLVIAVAACSKGKDQPAEPSVPPPAPVPVESAAAAPAPAPAAEAPAAAATAKQGTINAIVGSTAPDFTLKDLDGNDVALSSFKGKTVVLEWFNPGCPFVTKSHTVGSLVDTAKRHTANGVVWLAINSGAPGKQGHDPQLNVDRVKTWGLTHPVLRDESGTVGKAYGATRTPHMFVIDPNGIVVYGGAIDNSPDAEGKSPTDDKLVNYVDAALAALAAGQPVDVHDTKAYGCSVKYGS
jgi:peroxiredoxin